MVSNLVQELAAEERSLKHQMRILKEMLNFALTDLDNGADWSEMKDVVDQLDMVRSKIIALRYAQRLSRLASVC